jgi:ApbE superfamily uncharacterized protein (UPF0280 family)
VLASRIDRGLSSKTAARSAQVALSSDGRFLHLQDGPIDLIVSADGHGDCVRAAYRAAAMRFDGLLDELCEELVCLRRQAEPNCTLLIGKIARRMHAAVAPFTAAHFITPMAAVAGAVAEEILGAMTKAADLDRAYVNNGGDIAYHLMPEESYCVGLIDRPDRPSLAGRVIIDADGPVRGIATSGRRGRSFSLGIADSVTVLAGRQLRQTRQRQSSPTRSTFPTIQVSYAVPRAKFSSTATWVNASSHETSPTCPRQMSQRPSMPVCNVQARFGMWG